MFHIAFFTSTSPSLSCPLAGGKGNVSPPISIGPRIIIGGFPSIPRVFFFSLIKAFLHPRIKPHTLFFRHHPARIIFFLFVWHSVTQSIPEDASASRWINDRSAQARAGVTRARRGRESAEEERAGEGKTDAHVGFTPETILKDARSMCFSLALNCCFRCLS